MKKLTLLAAFFVLANSAFAGGILTNTNQSAQYVRMLSRNASTQLDAVYFNPAGLVKMEDGLHLGISNQSIFQTRTITSGFPYLNEGEYIGKITAPVFPDLFASWKKEKFALSFMVGPVGGGGGAKYETGLPSFESRIAAIPTLLSLNGVPTTGYSSDIFFEGTSVFWGVQLSGSYAINDIISLAAGVRVNLANNTYNGYLKDININPNQPAFGAKYNGSLQSAPQFFADASATLSTWSAGATAFASGLQPIVAGGGGEVLLANGTAVGLPAAQVAQIQGLLGAAGLSPAQIGGINVQTAQGTLAAAAPVLATKAGEMSVYSESTADMEVDTRQTGKGFTPIIGLNISPNDNLNIGIKYEYKTILKLTNDTEVDGTGLFEDGKISRSDLPSMLNLGIENKFSDAFSAQLSLNTFFDKGVNWGGNVYGQERTIDKNSWELSLGLQYNISDNFAVSIGGMQSTSGVSEQYQSDFSYSNSSNTGGFGFEWKVSDALTLDAGMLYTIYKDETKQFEGYSETYDKENIGFAIGLSYSIF
ncbi:MAG: aromatic hydrocarbon degradation membrane [Prolixibacteraceae bacterium]|nr:MAG: aromatic hydrocarbon degradation membrane [Prolixibacteraceae bacterium]